MTCMTVPFPVGCNRQWALVHWRTISTAHERPSPIRVPCWFTKLASWICVSFGRHLSGHGLSRTPRLGTPVPRFHGSGRVGPAGGIPAPRCRSTRSRSGFPRTRDLTGFLGCSTGLGRSRTVAIESASGPGHPDASAAPLQRRKTASALQPQRSRGRGLSKGFTAAPSGHALCHQPGPGGGGSRQTIVAAGL